MRSPIILPPYYEHLLDEFLTEHNYGAKACHDATWIVKRYLEHFSKLGHSTLAEVTLNDVRDYIMECALAVKSSTLHDIFVYLRQFHVYLKKSGIEAPDAEGLFSDTIHREMPIQGYITDDEIHYASGCKPEYISVAMDVAKIKSQRDDPLSKVEYLTESAAKAILATPDISTPIGRRDRMILVMLYDTGARISGLLGIRLADLHLDGSTPTVTVLEKGNVLRTISLAKETMPLLKHYLAEFHKGEPLTSSAFLFYIGHKSGPQKLCGNTVRRRIDKYTEKARIKCLEIPEHVHPHMWRHTRAMHLYQHGMPLELVAQWLGHRNQETTKVYAYADAEHKRKAIEKAMQAGAPKPNESDNTEVAESAGAYHITDEELIKKLYGLA